MAINTPSIDDASAGLGAVYQLLDTNKSQISQSNDPLVNEQLTRLLNELYATQGSLDDSLEKPTTVTINSLSNSALIALLMTEVRKTNDLIITATSFEIKNNQKVVEGRNNEMLEKIKDAGDAQKEADKLSAGLDIFKWIMLALSILLTIISVVATALTFGAAAPVLVISLVILAASVALTIATSVPVDDEQNSAMDLAGQELSKAIAEVAKQNLIDDYEESTGKKFADLPEEAQQAYFTEAEETGAYSSMAIMVTIQIIIAIVMLVASLGTAWASAANGVNNAVNGTANAARAATQTSIAAALQAAKATIQNNLPMIQASVRIISGLGSITKDVGTLAGAGVTADKAYWTYEATVNQADADQIKALVKYLSANNDMLIDLIAQLQESNSNTFSGIADLIKSTHGAHKRIAQNADGAQFA